MNQDEFKKIISQAISQEVEAFTFYNTVSDKAKDVISQKAVQRPRPRRGKTQAHLRRVSYQRSGEDAFFCVPGL